MHVAVVTLFPEMFEAISSYGVSGRAVERGILQLRCINPREFASDRHRTVDDRPYGGGPGMVMLIEPLKLAVEAAQAWLEDATGEAGQVVYLSPQGRKLDQTGVFGLKQQGNLVLIAGRYEGIDERFVAHHVDEEWSIGDYVVSGGELPAMVLIDAITRLLPGALGDSESAEQDSFVAGLLDCPHYTRPPRYDGLAVPEVLMSGDHKKIARWRLQQSLGRTQERRPDLIEKLQLTDEQQSLLAAYIESDAAKLN